MSLENIDWTYKQRDAQQDECRIGSRKAKPRHHVFVGAGEVDQEDCSRRDRHGWQVMTEDPIAQMMI